MSIKELEDILNNISSLEHKFVNVTSHFYNNIFITKLNYNHNPDYDIDKEKVHIKKLLDNFYIYSNDIVVSLILSYVRYQTLALSYVERSLNQYR